ncbi:MAG: accessory factor UbiK family protein [Maricaulaceae bacterium]|nr:accessory factor UbiK family protein [Maricaulaceae bacterium]
MQTRNPLFNDFAELMSDAFAAAQAAGDEAKAAFRAQAERFAADMDLVSREEFEAVKTAAAKASAEVEALKARIAALEDGKKPAARRTTAKKPAAPRKTTAKKR